MRVGFIGDLHGEHKRRALELFVCETGVDLCVSTGDFQDYRGGYSVPVVFIHGNHECWGVLDEMAEGTHRPPGLRYLPDFEILALEAVRLIGVGGAWSPADSDRSRHLTQRHVDALIRHQADIVLSHDTPIAFSNLRPGRDGRPRTIAALRIACERMSPRFWFSGHHHHYDLERLGRTTIVSVGYDPARSCVSGGGARARTRLSRTRSR